MPAQKTQTKVVTKKVSLKKPIVSKKAVKKVASKKPLVYARDTESFWVVDGQILNSLVSLAEALSSMEKEVYAHHVTAEKNDFADWVEKVLGDSACAVALRKSKTATSARTVVVKYLKTYTV